MCSDVHAQAPVHADTYAQWNTQYRETVRVLPAAVWQSTVEFAVCP